MGRHAEHIAGITCLWNCFRRDRGWSGSTARDSRRRRTGQTRRSGTARGGDHASVDAAARRASERVQGRRLGRDGGSARRFAAVGAKLAPTHRGAGGRFPARESSNAPASEPAPLVARAVTRWCATYCSEGISCWPRLLFDVSGASEVPIPAAEEPGRRRRSVADRNPGELPAGETRLDVPVTVAAAPVTQPGDTQFD